MPYANANPEKRFFIDLITRDISLEDAILDLIDNSIDSLVRIKNVDIYKNLMGDSRQTNTDELSSIKINFSPKQFVIEDNCGGITFEHAENDVFRFGHPDPNSGASLSVFGIGMKRALFKIGRKINIESQAQESGFTMDLDVNEWIKDESENWRIPLDEKPSSDIDENNGTKITITSLRDEVSTLVKNPTFYNKLTKSIQETYPFYLGAYLRIFINNKEIIGEDLSFGESDSIKPSIEVWKDGDVKAYLICGLLPRENNKWKTENSGWYLLCNGRVVVNADKTKLTGWGDILPQFMPKNRGFLGIVFYMSIHPEELPWNTTKRGINTESPVYIRSLKRMVSSARLVIQFQNKLYAKDDSDEPKEEYRESVKNLNSTSATKQAAQSIGSAQIRKAQIFKYTPSVEKLKYTTIRFEVKVEDIECVKKRMGRILMSNKEVGLKIFKYYMDRECSK